MVNEYFSLEGLCDFFHKNAHDFPRNGIEVALLQK